MSLLSTGSTKIDALLGGGVEDAVITLLYGEGGAGKTNLCLMISKQAVLSGTRVVYIDTEGVSSERLRQISGNAAAKIGKGILFSEPYSLQEQHELISKGVSLIETGRGIGVLIVDSLTVYYRQVLDDANERRELAEQLNILMTAARKYRIPVVVTSQVYTDINRNTVEPLGGHVLQHAAKTVLKLERLPDGKRRVTLMKHRHMRERTSVDFQITETGIE
ncbi:MAG: DNA repair and recombination protein RadB [Methanomassiliicoccales archaeon]